MNPDSQRLQDAACSPSAVAAGFVAMRNFAKVLFLKITHWVGIFLNPVGGRASCEATTGSCVDSLAAVWL